jgi:deoxyribodipyrimidine photolyase-related protein
MSDYCKNCSYDPHEKISINACPFNFLYWNFLFKNQSILRTNLRMKLSYRNLDRMPENQLKALVERADNFLKAINIF